METRANYIIIGAFTFIVAIAAVGFGFFAARFAVDRAWNRYEILFTESVIGLSRGSPVLYNGVNVGRVESLQLNPQDVREVLAVVEIDAAVPIHVDAEATIRLTGLTGTAAIQLRGGTPDTPLLEARGDRLPRIEAVESPLARLLESSEGIVVTANRVIERLDRLVSADNLERIENTLAAVDRLTTNLAAADGDVMQLVADLSSAGRELPGLTRRLESVARRFDGVLAGVDAELVDHLPRLRRRLDASLANLESLSARVDGIVAHNQDALMQVGSSGMRNVNAGLEDLRRLIGDLSAVVRRIEQNPSQFLFGGDQPEEYSPQ